jgi:hypothetical protein
MIPILLSALLAAGQPATLPEDEDTTFSERQPVRLAPLPLAQALGAFRDICVTGFPDAATFNRAAGASTLGFVQSAHPEHGAQEWSSRHGQIVYRLAPNPEREARRDRRAGHDRRQRWRERCDYWVAVEERMDTAALVAAIGAQLAPQARAQEEIVGWSWDLGASAPGTTLRLVYLPSDDDPRLFTLSLQRLHDVAAP